MKSCNLQELRNLRYKQGYSERGGGIAQCQRCGSSFTAENVADLYLDGHTIGPRGNSVTLSSKDGSMKKRCEMVCLRRNLQFESKSFRASLPRGRNPHLCEAMIHRMRNIHVHTASCFKKGIGLPCRYRLPRSPQPEAKTL